MISLANTHTNSSALELCSRSRPGDHIFECSERLSPRKRIMSNTAVLGKFLAADIDFDRLSPPSANIINESINPLWITLL